MCLRSSALWKVVLVNDEIGYLAEEISKQSVEDAAWLLTAYSKMEEDLKMELLSKKKIEIKNLENSQPIHITKNRNSYSEENMKVMAKHLFKKEITIYVNHKLNQPLHQETANLK